MVFSYNDIEFARGLYGEAVRILALYDSDKEPYLLKVAINLLGEAVRANPSPALYAYLAKCELERGNKAEAGRLLGKAQELKPGSPELQSLLKELDLKDMNICSATPLNLSED